MYKITRLVLLFILPLSLAAQQLDPGHHDHLAPLHSNPVVMQAAKQLAAQPHIKKAMSMSMDTLPFLDDFSKPGPYPDTGHWVDRNVYVNYNMAVCPYTLGVATFDGLDSVGLPYKPALSPYGADTADFLTSKPINWALPKPKVGNYTLNDSIYFSFYYQAGSYFGVDGNGRSSLGYFPNTNDTLQLQFRAAGQLNWHTVWAHEGYTPTADTDTVFHRVMIPFDSTKLAYMTSGFQFRFMNYSSPAGADHWSIDEVYLNAHRSYADTTQNDVTFVYDAPSMLANYTAEPWEQYQLTDWRSTPMHLFERNNKASAGGNPTSHNIVNETYNYTINTAPTTTYLGGAYNLWPFVDSGYNKYPQHADPALKTLNFPASLTGPTTFTITHSLQNLGDFDLWNDTLRFNQVFDNYYAYDNGCPEAAYYVNGYNSVGGGTVPFYQAFQFSLNKADTIFGMQIYIDYDWVNAKNYTFKLIVWNDKGGAPGDTVYVDDTIQNPIYPADGIDQFAVYKFRKPKSMPAGKFYVGWELTQGDSINIGFEFNQNHQNQIFYCENPYAKPLVWYNSTYNGTAMVRPLVGSPKGPASIETLNTTPTDITLYPNPARNEVYLSAEMHNVTLRILGEDGRVLYTADHFSGNRISTADLPNGFYLVQLTTEKDETTFKKMMISR